MSEGKELLQGDSGDSRGLQRLSVDSQDAPVDSQVDSQIPDKSSTREISDGVKSVQEKEEDEKESLKNGCLSDHDASNGKFKEPDVSNGNLKQPEVEDNGSFNGDTKRDSGDNGDAKRDSGDNGDTKRESGDNGEVKVGNGTTGDAEGDNGTPAGDSKPGDEDPDEGKREVGEALDTEGKEIRESGEEMGREGKCEDTVDTGKAFDRGDKEKEDEKGEEEEEEEEEGVDPFSTRPGLEEEVSRPESRKGGKTVAFKEPEKEEEEEEEEEARLQNGNSPSSPSSSGKVKEGQQEEEGEEEEKEVELVQEDMERRQNKQWTLGEGNPVYRLSMKLSPNLFNMMDIPAANQHQDPDKAGYLNKLSGRSFPYIPQWKRRYCVLSRGRLYYYEREDSRQGEKSNGVINLEYFDQVNEALPKECKKATNVFIITSQDRSFFDPGRHLFSADTLPDMKDWIRRLHGALEQIRNNNRPPASHPPPPAGMETGRKRKEEEGGVETKEDKENKENQLNSSTTREKKKKKEDTQRSHKSARTTDTAVTSSETQTTTPETQHDGPSTTTTKTTVTKATTKETKKETTTLTGPPISPKGGVQLPGFSAFKPKLEERLSRQKEAMTKEEVTKRASHGEDVMPSSGPTLTSVTKHRVRGPQGRRAPQSNRRTMAALKKRASSLSALEHQDSLDTRSESSQSGRGSSLRHSGTPDWDMREEMMKEEMEPLAEESIPERHVSFDDIEGDLFFKPLREVVGRDADEDEGRGVNNNTKKYKKNNSNRRVRIEEQEKRRSRNGTLGSKLSRFSETMASFKPSRFKSKEPIGPDHPDQVDHSRWTCVVL